MTTTTVVSKTITANSTKTPPIIKRVSKSKAVNHDMWKNIEIRIQENLDNFESARKYCAYCSRNDNYENLARCYGCQMVYYCSQEHQLNDWLEHMQKCAELEWVALGELIQSIPAPPTICELGQNWSKSILDIQTWTDWFDMRPHILKIARNTAKIFDNIKNINKKREPSYEDVIDGLLAAVTDSMTYSLTIGNTLVKLGINPSVRPVCIHCLHSTNDFNLNTIDLIKRQFYELCNMFPGCKGFEIVFIGTDINTNIEINEPFMKIDQKYLPRNQQLYLSGWYGTYANYIKYQCQIEGYSLPDLIVSFHPNFTSSPYKLINEWTDDLKIILINNFSCLFTFYDSDEKLKAFNTLNAFQTNILYSQLNQFSSLLMKQLVNKPNHVYANNSYFIIIRGFIDTELDLRYNQQQQQQQQQLQNQTQVHASVQTIGIDEPENQSLKHVNGKLHIQMNKQNNLNELSGESDENLIIDVQQQFQQQQQQNDKIAFRPLNFLKPQQQQQEQQIQAKNYELNENNLKKYLNSGFATPSSETSGSYYQPKINLTFSVNNHHYEEERDSTDEAKKDGKKFSHYPHVKKLHKSKSLQKIEFPNADDDDDDDDDDSNNEPVIDHYGTLPAPKPRNYASISDDKPSVKPRKPKPKPRLKLSNSDENSLEKKVNTDEAKEIQKSKSNVNITQTELKKVENNPKEKISIKISTSTSPPPQIINKQSTLSSSSPRQSPNSSISIPSTSGFVSQMKSKFESQMKKQESNLIKPTFTPSSKFQIQNLTAKLASSSTNSSLFKFNRKNSSSKDDSDLSQSSATPPSTSVPPPPIKSPSVEIDNQNNEYMNIDNFLIEDKFQTIEDLNNSASLKQHQHQQQSMLAEFRILDRKNYEIQRQRSLTPSTKSLTASTSGNNNVFIKHVPDPVDVVNIKYEGERRVIVPGYLTSADILRNSLISNVSNSTDENSSNSLSLKEKLRLQQPELYKATRTSTPPSVKSIVIPLPIHIAEKFEVYDRNLSNQPVEIGNNTLFQRVVKETENRPTAKLIPPPPPPPPQPPQFLKECDLTTSYPSKLQKFPIGQTKLPSPPPIITKSKEEESVKQQQILDDDIYSLRSRSKSMCGVLKLDDKPKAKAVINFDLIDDDYSCYEVKKSESIPPEPVKIENHLPKIEIPIDVPSSSDYYEEYEKEKVNKIEPKQPIVETKSIYVPRQPPPPPVPPPLPPTRAQVNKKPEVNGNNDETHYAVSPVAQQPVKQTIEQKTQLLDLQRKESVTGSFDPSDFDSFDESDTTASTRLHPAIQLPLIILPNPIPEMPSPKLTTFKSITPPNVSPKKTYIEEGQFDPNDFDSFDEEDKVIETPRVNNDQMESNEPDKKLNPDEYNLNHFNNSNKINSFKSTQKSGGGKSFFRNALNRLSTSRESKKRSSSVPPSKLLNELNNEVNQKKPQQDETSVSSVNMKTLHLMNKMQIEHEEKQKRRKLRLLKQQEQQQQQQIEPANKTPKSEKKFLNNLMSSLFNKDTSSSSYEQQVSITTTTTTTTTVNVLQKNESRRLSLRKLKAKDKAKKQGSKGDGGDNTSDGETQNLCLSNSSQSLNLYRSADDEPNEEKTTSETLSPAYIRSSSFDSSTLQSRVGSSKVPGNEKLDIMKQIRAELDEEIKSRFAVENANKKFDASTPIKEQPQQPQPRRSRQETKRNFEHEANLVSSSMDSNSLHFNSAANRKIRSKSVTFLDDITTDDEILSQQLNRNSLSFVSNRTNDEYSSNENSTPLLTSSVTTKRKALLKTGDARYHCGALTGVGPIRSIMKKSATDLSITLNTPLIQNDNLPRIELNSMGETTPQLSPENRYNPQTPVKSATLTRPHKKIQSDL